MLIRKGELKDLAALKSMFGEIVADMEKRGIAIWDDYYPFEFLEEDIKRGELYLAEDGNNILSSFTLTEVCEGSECILWKTSAAKALYLDRFGVNVSFQHRGIASLMLKEAINLASSKAETLRLFVVDCNTPAIKLYEKSGFERCDGYYDLHIDDDTILREFGFEFSCI